MAWITNLLTDNCVHIAHRGMLVLNLMSFLFCFIQEPHDVIFSLIEFFCWTYLLYFGISFIIFIKKSHILLPLLFVGRLFLLIIPLASFCVIKPFCLLLKSLWKWMDFSALDFFSKGSWKCIYCMGYCKNNHFKHLQNNVSQMRVQQLGIIFLW